MSELTLMLIRFAYLAILWIFVLSAISVVRSDMFGARVDSTPRAERKAEKRSRKEDRSSRGKPAKRPRVKPRPPRPAASRSRRRARDPPPTSSWSTAPTRASAPTWPRRRS